MMDKTALKLQFTALNKFFITTDDGPSLGQNNLPVIIYELFRSSDVDIPERVAELG